MHVVCSGVIHGEAMESMIGNMKQAPLTPLYELQTIEHVWLEVWGLWFGGGEVALSLSSRYKMFTLCSFCRHCELLIFGHWLVGHIERGWGPPVAHLWARGSMARTNRLTDSGHPCLTPDWISTGSVKWPLMLTLLEQSKYSKLIHALNC